MLLFVPGLTLYACIRPFCTGRYMVHGLTLSIPESFLSVPQPNLYSVYRFTHFI